MWRYIDLVKEEAQRNPTCAWKTIKPKRPTLNWPGNDVNRTAPTSRILNWSSADSNLRNLPPSKMTVNAPNGATPLIMDAECNTTSSKVMTPIMVETD
jgi:hypothetical protein